MVGVALRRVKITLEYDGTDFYGWQVQAATGERTVQGVIEQVLAAIPGAVPRVHAAGRTDAGVHALAMVAHYDTGDSIPDRQVARALNARLPEDVRVVDARRVGRDFQAQFHCRYRRYLYRIRLARDYPAGAALDRCRVWFVYQRLDVAAMQAAAKVFEGTNDFASMATQETRPTVRTVYACRLSLSGRDVTVNVVADGFLRGMVRAMIGTLLWVGEGRLAAEDVARILRRGDRTLAGPNAPPHGLYFAEAGYEEWRPDRM